MLKGKPSGDEKCENCIYYLENTADLSYCWHPKLRILIGAQWWCQWWDDHGRGSFSGEIIVRPGTVDHLQHTDLGALAIGSAVEPLDVTTDTHLLPLIRGINVIEIGSVARR